MKVIKPQTLSLLHRPYLLLSQWRLSVTALCGFALNSPRRLISEQTLWPILAETTGGFWDEGMPKFRGEMPEGDCNEKIKCAGFERVF